jgi:hypothetical protein
MQNRLAHEHVSAAAHGGSQAVGGGGFAGAGGGGGARTHDPSVQLPMSHAFSALHGLPTPRRQVPSRLLQKKGLLHLSPSLHSPPFTLGKQMLP